MHCRGVVREGRNVLLRQECAQRGVQFSARVGAPMRIQVEVAAVDTAFPMTGAAMPAPEGDPILERVQSLGLGCISERSDAQAVGREGRCRKGQANKKPEEESPPASGRFLSLSDQRWLHAPVASTRSSMTGAVTSERSKIEP